MAYQTSGCIAVHDHDALRHLDFVQHLSSATGVSSPVAGEDLKRVQQFVQQRKPGQVGHVLLPVCFSMLRSIAPTACSTISLHKMLLLLLSQVGQLCAESQLCSLTDCAGAHMAGHVQVDDPFLQRVKTLIRYTEARSAAGVCGVSYDKCIFLDLPFYQTGEDS